MNWRSRKLLDAIHELPCTWLLEHACTQHLGCVPMHSNQLRDGKGRGIKAHDYRVAAGCASAHQQCDESNKLSYEQKLEAWEAAHRMTIGLLFTLEIVVVR